MNAVGERNLVTVDAGYWGREGMDRAMLKKKKDSVLAGVAQWTECLSVKQGVAGLIPSQGTCLGCGPGPWLGVCKRQPHSDVSLSFSLSSSLSKNKE